MYKISGNIVIKGLAVCLLALMVMVNFFAWSTVASLEMKGSYDLDYDEVLESQFLQISRTYANAAFYHHYRNEDGKDSFSDKNLNWLEGTNFFYEIKDKNGEVLAGSKPDFAPYHTSEHDFQGGFDYFDYQTGEYEIKNSDRYTVVAYVDGSFAYKDLYYQSESYLSPLYAKRYLILAAAVISFLAGMALVVFLSFAAGRRRNEEEIQLRRVDKLPADLMLAATGAAIVAFLILLDYIFAYSYSLIVRIEPYFSIYEVDLVKLAVIGLVILITALILIALYMSLVVRLKTKTFLKNTLFYKIIYRPLAKLFGYIKFILSNIALVWLVALPLIILVILEFIFIYGSGYYFGYYGDFIFVLWLASRLVFSGFILLIAIGMTFLERAGKAIAAGDLTYKTNPRFLFGRLKNHASALDNIGKGMNLALADKMKSERLKTELITNVSHDIKTPLTSIINYVDLLGKEDLKPDKAKEYVAIVKRNCSRLQKLTEDLFEAAKITSGNTTVNQEIMDINIFLTQILAEYDDRFKEAKLEVVAAKPDQEVLIQADRRLMWRIMDNILNNTIKYTQTATRVYVDLLVNKHEAKIVVKNISASMLNISSDELMERFVRGDQSRSSEGSGLGLSIARGLTELQKGEFNLEIDGDLFKVSLVFRLLMQQPVKELLQ